MPSNPGNTKDSGNGKPKSTAGSSQGGFHEHKDEAPGASHGSGRVSGGASSRNLRLQLTPEQQQQIRKATGKDASSLELSVADIEDSLDMARSDKSDATGNSSSLRDSSSSSDYSENEEMGSESEF